MPIVEPPPPIDSKKWVGRVAPEVSVTPKLVPKPPFSSGIPEISKVAGSKVTPAGSRPPTCTAV
jgi:hypothetical protein